MMIFIELNNLLKNAIILSKNPAFEVIAWLSEETAFPFASQIVAVNAVSPLDEGVITQAAPFEETEYEKFPFEALRLT